MIVGGGFRSIRYSLKASNTVGYRKMFRAMMSKNTCKTCALGMGGQKGGMTNEMGGFPEVCKKAFQAQITDIQAPIPEKLFKENSIEDFKKITARLLEKSGRLNTPLYKAEGDTHYSAISWEKAVERIVNRFKTTAAKRSFFYSSGRSSNEAAFLLQLFARIYGTNNVNNCSYYCHQATGVGIDSTIGTGTATIQLQDIEKADLIFVIGANPASNHPRFVRQLMKCRRRGGHVVIINPVKEKGLVKFAIPSDFRSLYSGGSKIASEYIQVQIGGDIALLKGIAKAVIEAEKHDLKFMADYTNGKDEYLADIQNTPWETIVSNSGISQENIRHIAEIYGNSKNVIFSWSMGITHHEYGSENVESIVCLALLRGMIGRRYAGLLPLRGHSNVQGIGSVGVTPALKERFFNNIEKHIEVQLPTVSGMDTLACMKASHDGKIELAFLLGGNLYQSNPDTQFAEKALNAIPFKIYLNTTLNHGHFYGVDKEVLILPVAARDEEQQKTTQESMFNFVRLSDGGNVRLDNVRSEVEIISDIAEKVLADSTPDFVNLKYHQNLREFIAKVVPGYEKLGKIGESGEEFQIPNRTFYQPQFATPDHKANFRVCPIPLLKGEEGEFRMMTVRSEGQFNTIIYEEEDLLREQTSRWIVLMNKDDIRKKGLQENDLVTLESSVGKMEKIVVREFDIPSGNIITYFPESNVLVPTITDPRSKTPGYKLVWVKISPFNNV
ncbi:MAG: FdhF/YdeP family oxidoreductase [Bacteroidetes bacterium]|nr:FdhF/YdeP family oxidoreductase [Bacteroidota bacterium]